MLLRNIKGAGSVLETIRLSRIHLDMLGVIGYNYRKILARRVNPSGSEYSPSAKAGLESDDPLGPRIKGVGRKAEQRGVSSRLQAGNSGDL